MRIADEDDLRGIEILNQIRQFGLDMLSAMATASPDRPRFESWAGKFGKRFEEFMDQETTGLL